MDFKTFKKNADKYRGGSFNKVKFTKEQIEFFKLCRDNPNPVPFTTMADLWTELGWGEKSSKSLNTYYLMIKRNKL